MKIWSSHFLNNLSNCLMNLKNSGDSTGFEPMTSAMPVQCSNQLSYEVTQWRAGQFVGLMFSRERNVVWKKCYMKCGVLKSNEDMILTLAGQFKQLLKLSSKCEDHIFIWFQNTALHITLLSYHINCVLIRWSQEAIFCFRLISVLPSCRFPRDFLSAKESYLFSAWVWTFRAPIS